jgi:DNA-binding MarR family transcriptional regulator
MSAADPDLAALAEDLRRAVGTFVRAVRRDSDTERAAQSEALALLDRDGPMNVATLASARRVTHQTMRLVVGQLDQAGWLLRVPDLADRRSRMLVLTDAGRAELVRGRNARAARIATQIGTRLSAEERQILRASVALFDRMSHADDDGSS